MTDWFHRLEDDLRHVTSVFHHHGDTITAEAPQTPSPAGAPVPLADTSAALDSDITSIRTGLQNALAAGHDVLDNLVSQLDQHAADVRAVAAIADSPIVVAAAGALHVPPEILDGFARSLTAIAAAWPKPQEAPAEVPAEPQPEQAEQAA